MRHHREHARGRACSGERILADGHDGVGKARVTGIGLDHDRASGREG